MQLCIQKNTQLQRTKFRREDTPSVSFSVTLSRRSHDKTPTHLIFSRNAREVYMRHGRGEPRLRETLRRTPRVVQS